MATDTVRLPNVSIAGNLRFPGTEGSITEIIRANLAQEANAVYPIPLWAFRTWDALATNLPGTAAADDLALVTGTLGTDQPTIEAGDIGGTSSTRYARVQIPLPIEYEAGQTVTIRINGHMTTTVADTSCTVDVEAYRVERDGGVGSDLCSTAATSINSLTAADKDFTIDPATLGPGDLLDIRIAIAYADTGDAGVMTPTLNAVELLCDVRG